MLTQIARPIKSYIGAAFGSGEQWQSWIHVEDLARMFIFILETKLVGTFNGVAPNPVTNAKLTKEIAKVLEKPIFLPNIPQFVMKLVLGEMSYLVYTSQRVSSKQIEKKGFKFNFNTVCAALQDVYKSDTAKEAVASSYNKEYV